MIEVKVKKEYENLDKNNFDQVCDLVDRIVEDIWLSSEDDEILFAMIKDYMIDLINPDLLDFDSMDS
jgi:hypothetical protein